MLTISHLAQAGREGEAALSYRAWDERSQQVKILLQKMFTTSVKLLGGQLLFTKVTKIVFRRVSSLEEDLEKTEEKMLAAASKLDKASTACDDSERAKKVER